MMWILQFSVMLFRGIWIENVRHVYALLLLLHVDQKIKITDIQTGSISLTRKEIFLHGKLETLTWKTLWSTIYLVFVVFVGFIFLVEFFFQIPPTTDLLGWCHTCACHPPHGTRWLVCVFVSNSLVCKGVMIAFGSKIR